MNENSEDEDSSPFKNGSRPTKSELDGLMVGGVNEAIPEEPIEVEGINDSIIEGQTVGGTPAEDSKRVTMKEPLDLTNALGKAMEETLGNTKFSHLKMNTENPISPVKTKTKNVKARVFAENYHDRVHFNEMHLFHTKEKEVKKGFGSGAARMHNFGAVSSNPSGLYPSLKGLNAPKNRTGSARSGKPSPAGSKPGSAIHS